jgi:hypothetical protein
MIPSKIKARRQIQTSKDNAKNALEERKDESLLNLAMGVQSYLSERAHSDSPLHSLECKLYAYTRQAMK